MASISAIGSESKCMLTLYRVDSRISNDQPCDKTEHSFSRLTAYKAMEVVESYFKVDQNWDRTLLSCAFLDDVQYDWFEYYKTAEPHIRWGIKIMGERDLLSNGKPGNYYVPKESFDQLAVRVKSLRGNNEYNLDYQQIKSERFKDFYIVSFYNSESFKTMIQNSTNLVFSRTLEKINHTP